MDEDSFISRCWSGEVSLPRVYWLVHGLGTVFLLCFAEALAKTVGSQGQALIGLAELAWLGFVWVSVWRCSTTYSANYPYRAIWGILAKVAVILGILVTFGRIAEGMNKTASSYPSYASVSHAGYSPYNTTSVNPADSYLSIQLPQKLNSIETVTALEVNGNEVIAHIYYDGSLGRDKSAWAAFARSITDYTCARHRDDMDRGVAFKDIFSDPAGSNLFYVEVFLSDCA